MKYVRIIGIGLAVISVIIFLCWLAAGIGLVAMDLSGCFTSC